MSALYLSRYRQHFKASTHTTTYKQRAAATPATPTTQKYPEIERMASFPTAVRFRLIPRVAVNFTQARRVSDVAITRTGKPIIRVQGGR